MTILGKVLIVFNLLAAGAFAYFTLEDRRVRKDLTKEKNRVVKSYDDMQTRGRRAR